MGTSIAKISRQTEALGLCSFLDIGDRRHGFSCALQQAGINALFNLHMKQLHVACAIIEQEGTVLATQRSEAMSLPLKWEFPGGKINDGERLEECLKREVQEELGLVVSVGRPLTPVTHHYSTFSVTLYPFICRITAGDITLHEHKAFTWLPPEKLHELDWAAADGPVINEYLATYASSH